MPTPASPDPKALSQRQFGANAANYATSAVHARGASLGRLVELVEPQSDWRVLDIATAAGHTAFTMAEHTERVLATDLTAEMVALARDRAIELGATNVDVARTDAEALGFGDASFDLVTSRIAPHHFPAPSAFVLETARVLRTGGVFALVDNIVPADPDAARWYNDWERRRDPSHVRCLSLAEWADLADVAGLEVEATEAADKQMGFEAWCDNLSVPGPTRADLLADLFAAPPTVTEFLRPEGGDETATTFMLTEGILIARKRA